MDERRAAVRGTRRCWWAVGVGAVVLAMAAPGGFGGLVGLAGAGGTSNSTTTTSTRHTTSTQRVDLEDAPAPECEYPGSPAVLVDQTSTDLEPVVTLENTIGPATILIGDLDTGGTPFEVPAGTTNLNILSTYERVVTQYFQATAAAEACAVVLAAARFTG